MEFKLRLLLKSTNTPIVLQITTWSQTALRSAKIPKSTIH